MLSSYMDAQAMSDLVTSTFALHEERLLAAAGLDVHAGKDMIVNIPNIILAFAGRVRPACWQRPGVAVPARRSTLSALIPSPLPRCF